MSKRLCIAVLKDNGKIQNFDHFTAFIKEICVAEDM